MAQLAQRGHRADVEDQVLDVAVAVLLHAARVGGDPPAEGGELDAVRLVSQRVPVLGELALDLTAHRARFDAGHPIHRVDPANPVHPGKVHYTDGPVLARGAAQRIGDVGSSPVGHQADLVTQGGLYQRRDLLIGLRADHEIGDPVEPAVLDQVHLFEGVPVTAAEPDLRVGRDGGSGQDPGDLSKKPVVPNRLGNVGRVLGVMDIAGLDVAGDRLPDPGEQVGQLDAAAGIAIALEDHAAIGKEIETGTAKAPDVRAFLLVGRDGSGIGHYAGSGVARVPEQICAAHRSHVNTTITTGAGPRDEPVSGRPSDRPARRIPGSVPSIRALPLR